MSDKEFLSTQTNFGEASKISESTLTRKNQSRSNSNNRYSNSKQNNSNDGGFSFMRARSPKMGKQPSYYQHIIDKLSKQNQQLRKQIVQLRISQFYQFDQNKLKDLLTEIQTLKSELKFSKSKVDQLMVVNDFLQRNNKKLKQQCQNLMKSLSSCKNTNSIYTYNDPKKQKTPILNFQNKSKLSHSEIYSQMSPARSYRRLKPSPERNIYETQFVTNGILKQKNNQSNLKEFEYK